MIKLLRSTALLIFIFGCEKNEPNNFFPVLSFIESQVAHVDTSLYSIIKVESDGTRDDTTYIPVEQFRKEANEFLTIPDLSRNKYGKHYKEERNYDETIGRVLITYLPEKDNLEVTRQEVVILPSFGGEDKVRNIIIEKRYSNRDSTVTKRLLWQVDQSFKVATVVDLADQTTRMRSTEIIWNKPVE